jgi:hypothetical protein
MLVLIVTADIGKHYFLICISTYTAVIINYIYDVTMGCAMTKNIQEGMPVIYEILGYTAILLTLIGIVTVSVLHSGAFI